MLEDVIVTCPYCGEETVLAIDLSVEAQAYVEDCSVCCQPMLVRYAVEDGQLTGITVDQENA